MLQLATILLALDALICLAMGVRYSTRTGLLPYQVKALGRGLGDFDPALQAVMRAMIKAVGGGFLGFGVAALGLVALLWQGDKLAGYALVVASAALLTPVFLAASSLARFAPASGAPTRLTLIAAAIDALAFLALLAS